MEGWIRAYRQMLDNPVVCKDSDYFAVWVYLLLNATHQEYDTLFKGKRITLQKGQLITGTISISKKLKVNKDKVQRILKSFENDKQIAQQASNRNRLITILNWDKYQEFDKQNDKQVINKCETDDKQLITNKNGKNIKNNNEQKKILLEHFNLIWEKYPNKKGKAKAIEYYLQWIKGRTIAGITRKLTDEQMYYAVVKYQKECEKNGIEQQFIKHGDTFFNKAILDYVEVKDE